MAEVRRHSFTLFGETIQIVTDETDEYLNTIIEHIENTVRNFSRGGQASSLTPTAKALFTCIFLGDELYKEKEKSENLLKELNTARKDAVDIQAKSQAKPTQKNTDAEKYKKEAERLKKLLNAKDEEFKALKKEFDEFIMEFDVNEKNSDKKGEQQ